MTELSMLLMVAFDCQIVFVQNFVLIWKQNYNTAFFFKNFKIKPCSSFPINIYFSNEWKNSITQEKRWLKIQ